MKNYHVGKIKKFIDGMPRLSQSEIAVELNNAGFTTQRGRPWSGKLVSNFMLYHMKPLKRRSRSAAIEADREIRPNRADEKLALIELIIGLDMPQDQKINTIKAVVF